MRDSIRWTRREWIGASVAGIAALAVPGRARAATTLRWATVLPTNHPSVAMMERVAKQVREETGGSVDIQTFPAGQLGSSRDLIEAASSGAVQIVDEGAAQFGQFVPQYSILEAPYIWRDPQQVRRVLGSPLVDEMNAQLVDKRSMRVIGSTYYGKRHVTSGSKAINTVDDMKGFKLRIPEVDTFRAMAEAWGARPTPLNISELYLALSQGAVDGQENPLPTIQSNKFFEVQKYLVLTGHIITPRLVVVNEGVWQKLSAKERQALRSSLETQGAVQDNEILAQESKLADTFKSAGMTVIQPDVESFRKPVLASLPAKFESKWGKGLWERIAAA
jgi:tripartite ATP-independent transporter DctP family solute receptor